jgi:hypothetical protein
VSSNAKGIAAFIHETDVDRALLKPAWNGGVQDAVRLIREAAAASKR